MKRMFLAAAAFAALAACATPTTLYGPADAKGIGWRQQQIEADRYRVTFIANADKKPPLVEDLALRRAAELTRDNGGSWFRVVDRYTNQVGGRPNGGTSVGVGGSTGSYGSGVGVGVGFDLSPDSRKYETRLEILIGRGAKPDDPNAYDVQSFLGRSG